MNTLALLTLLGLGVAQNGDVQVIKLSDLDLSKAIQEYGVPQKDKSCDNNPLKIAGQSFSHGFGTHAASNLTINLKGGGVKFAATVGIDDETKGKGSVDFEVWLDNKVAWKSGVMRGNNQGKAVEVDLKGAKVLRLVVNEADNGNDNDHADWAGAVITMKKGAAKPITLGMPTEPPMKIYHFVPGPTEIHGPRITGAGTGHDFLFKIPATGIGTLTYSAKGLPEGLSLDPSTGIIKGKVAKAGNYKVQLEVKGKKGVAKRELTISIGNNKLALTPPLGWNSWNVWATSITAERTRAAGKAMVDSGLANFGFTYVNIDDGWEAGRNEDGTIQLNEKFGDMKLLANEIHAMGLKLGIYSSPGPFTCGRYTGSYKHEFQDAKSYADWGIDYLKYDWCSYGDIDPNPDLAGFKKPYALMREALDAAGRDIVYSLCQYGMGDVWKWGNEVGADCWRTTGDINDSWGSMAGIGFAQIDIAKYAKPSGWNDPDMMVVGMLGWSSNPRPTRLKPNEQITHLTIWSMISSPILLGCDLTKLDSFTKDLLMNDDILAVHQDFGGKMAYKVKGSTGAEVWARELWDGTTAVALFNRGVTSLDVSVTLKELGLKGPIKARDCWQRKDLGLIDSGLSRKVPAHGSMMFRLGNVKK